MHLNGPSMAIKFLYAPAPPPPTEWSLKPPSWALVHKTTYAPMIYTALCIMFCMHSYLLLGQVGGVGHWKSWVFWASNGTHLSARCHFTGPKNSQFPGPPPLPSHPKHYARGCIYHRCIKSYFISVIPIDIPCWQKMRVESCPCSRTLLLPLSPAVLASPSLPSWKWEL